MGRPVIRDDLHYAMVADVALEADRAGWPRDQYVALTWDVTTGTANMWMKVCRNRRLLGPSPRTLKGGKANTWIDERRQVLNIMERNGSWR